MEAIDFAAKERANDTRNELIRAGIHELHEKGLEDFKSLIRVFFAYGGFAAQGNIVTGEKLKEAQLHPEKYSTLQIRVCGWNEYFVKLSKAKQDMFIRQSEVLRS